MSLVKKDRSIFVLLALFRVFLTAQSQPSVLQKFGVEYSVEYSDDDELGKEINELKEAINNQSLDIKNLEESLELEKETHQLKEEVNEQSMTIKRVEGKLELEKKIDQINEELDRQSSEIKRLEDNQLEAAKNDLSLAIKNVEEALGLKIDQLNEKLDNQSQAIEFLEKGWVVLGEYRLWFSLYGTDWQSAQKNCKDKHARLVSGTLKIDASSDYIFNYVRNEGKAYWIGLNDRETEGRYEWSDGGTLPTTSLLWGVGQPDNGHGRGQDCVRIWDKKLDDERCAQIQRFICEMHA